MSSKIRIYQDNKRIATAAFLKTGEVLQVYPTKRKFQTEGDFRTNWKNYVISTLEFRESHPPPKLSKPAKPVKPSKSAKSESKKADTPKACSSQTVPVEKCSSGTARSPTSAGLDVTTPEIGARIVR